MRKMEGKDEKEEKEGKEGGGSAHSIDSRAISAIVREREQAGAGQGIINCGGDIHQHHTAFLIPNIYPS